MEAMNAIDRLRIGMGITRPDMLELIGAKPGKLFILTSPERQLDPIYLRRAESLYARYQEWEAEVEAKIALREAQGYASFTAVEVQDLFSLRDMNLHQLRHRGVIRAERNGNDKEYYYPIEALREILAFNKVALEQPKNLRGPLTAGFLRWLGKQEAGGLDMATKGRVTYDKPIPRRAPEGLVAV